MLKVGATEFINTFKTQLHEIIHSNPSFETENKLEGIAKEDLNKILKLKPLSIFIPKQYGGLGDNPAECLALLESTAYESIAVALALGINGSLFLEPVAKYSSEPAKQHVFDRFLNHNAIGGLMITEPDFGTDALSMQTAYYPTEQGFNLKGIKHWGGLTGLADFWLVTARKQKDDSNLSRDIDLFICDQGDEKQKITVPEYYHKLGLFLIPYGLNKIDITVPENQKLNPKSSGLKLMMDLLHRSRLRLSGIGIGFIKRILDEASAHSQERVVGGKHLSEYDQVQYRLAQIQAWHTITSGICYYTSKASDVSNDLTSFALPANASKAVLTDMMQDAAQSLLQLVGAKGYRRDHIAGRAVTDSRPFQIFEGSNDVMYIQIADMLLKEMKKLKERNLFRFFSHLDLTRKIAERFKNLLNFELASDPIQRKKVVLGKLAARLITAEFTLELEIAGFDTRLVQNAMGILETTLAELVSTVDSFAPVNMILDDQKNGDWKSLNPN